MSLPKPGPASLKILEKMAAEGNATAKALIPKYKRAWAEHKGKSPGRSIAAEVDETSKLRVWPT